MLLLNFFLWVVVNHCSFVPYTSKYADLLHAQCWINVSPLHKMQLLCSTSAVHFCFQRHDGLDVVHMLNRAICFFGCNPLTRLVWILGIGKPWDTADNACVQPWGNACSAKAAKLSECFPATLVCSSDVLDGSDVFLTHHFRFDLPSVPHCMPFSLVSSLLPKSGCLEISGPCLWVLLFKSSLNCTPSFHYPLPHC